MYIDPYILYFVFIKFLVIINQDREIITDGDRKNDIDVKIQS